MRISLAWLVYRKLRPSIGIPVAFTVMSGALLGADAGRILLVSLGFFLIDIFGNFYNDCWDYEEDKRNARKDKLTTSGYISVRTAFRMSIVFAAFGLGVLLIGGAVFFLGLSYCAILLLYSHGRVRLKGSVAGYGLVAAPFFILPFFMAGKAAPAEGILPLSFFFFFQYAYILCQKDSTDMKDKSNLFLRQGRSRSSFVVLLFAGASSLCLLLLSAGSLLAMAVWIFNLSSKSVNVYRISTGTITRSIRGNLMLLEFATPYLFLLDVLA